MFYFRIHFPPIGPYYTQIFCFVLLFTMQCCSKRGKLLSVFIATFSFVSFLRRNCLINALFKLTNYHSLDFEIGLIAIGCIFYNILKLSLRISRDTGRQITFYSALCPRFIVYFTNYLNTFYLRNYRDFFIVG